jgi:hypothetical protein
VEQRAGLFGGEVESSTWKDTMMAVAPASIPVRLPAPPRITTA